MKKNKMKRKKVKIVKNRDIEEIVEQEEIREKMQSAQQEVVSLEEKRQEFVESLSVQVEGRYNNYIKRKDAELEREKTTIQFLRSLAKLEQEKTEQEQQNEKEIQEFFDDIQRKTDEYLRKQDEQKNTENNKKQNKEQRKQDGKKKKVIRVSETSMKEILDTEEFRGIWKDSEEER